MHEIKNNQPVAIITGASSGLGAEFARQLGSKGYKIGLIARRQDLLQQLVDELQGDGIVAAYAVADVGETKPLQQAVATLEDTLGATTLLIANAGVGYPVKAHGFSAEKAAAMIRINVTGVMNAVGAVLPGMLQRDVGQVVAISSLAAYRSFPQSHVYSASKAAVNAFFEGLRFELTGTKLRVTTICPGFIRTEMTDKNTIPMPCLLDCDVAVRRMLKAIEAGKSVYNFPRRIFWLLKCSRLVPDILIRKSFSGQFKKPYKKA